MDRPARSDVLQLKVTLKGTRPPIWRRFLMPADAPLSGLHDAIQGVMGWQDYHLHLFEIAGNQYGLPHPDAFVRDIDERRVALCDVVSEGSRFRYVYDFGDDWEHTVDVERVLKPEKGHQTPRCLKGARTCPPEDCGGVWGYQEFLAALADPAHERHDEFVEWIGGEEFDADLFDLDEANRRLGQTSDSAKRRSELG